jgi:hypothetical protein
MWPFDQNNQPMYQQYAQAYDTGNYNNFNQGDALGHILQFIQGAPPDLQQRVFQQHFEQMPYDQRMAWAQQVPPEYGMDPNNPWSMAQGFMRLGQERPDFLQRIFSHPLLVGGGVVLAGLIAKHVMEHHERERYNQYGGQPPYGYNAGPGYQDPYAQGIAQERREERELRSEIRREERDLDRLEDREERHHRHERDYW